MSRLTVKWNAKVYDLLDPVDIIDNEYSKINFEKMITKLGEYEDLEEQGLLVKLPCKVGDTVYSITRNFISEYKICSFEKYLEGFFFNWSCEKGIYKNIRGFTSFEIGKTVFLTKEEAEKALKEMEGEE